MTNKAFARRGYWLVANLSIVMVVMGSTLASAAVPESVLQAEQRRIAAIAKATKTAVAVFARGGNGGGSGVVITPDGYALTNFHVSKPAGDYMKCSMADGNLYDAVIVGIDPTGDVALIKLLGREDFPHAIMADSDKVRVGDWCFAVGNPFLLATDFQPTVTYGIVSGVHRYQYPAGTLLEYADCIQTDASINPGNSGGPLFNQDGDLIGINGRGSFEKRGRVNVGVGYAISINQIKHFMGYLRSGRIVDHATLGATVSSDEDGRVIVSNILDSCDAFRRGLRYGDQIVAFGGREITTVNGFKNVLGIFPKGWRVPLSYRRDGDRRDVLVRLMGVHSPEELLEKIEGPSQERPMPKPAPKPVPKPSPKKPGDQDEEQPTPQPIPVVQPHAAAKPPAEVAKLIKKRKGYANYYFNELNQDRLWDSMVAHGDFLELDGVWALRGESEGAGKVEISLNTTESSGRFPGEFVTLDPAKDYSEQIGPQGSGGLLVALHLWRRFLTVGPDRFGEVYYLGTGPAGYGEGLFDILVTTHNVVETRFMFDPQSGLMTGMEMFSDPDRDPCEIYFEDYREVDGRQVPHLLHVRFGDDIYGNIKLESVELKSGPAGET